MLGRQLQRPDGADHAAPRVIELSALMKRARARRASACEREPERSMDTREKLTLTAKGTLVVARKVPNVARPLSLGIL